MLYQVLGVYREMTRKVTDVCITQSRKEIRQSNFQDLLNFSSIPEKRKAGR